MRRCWRTRLNHPASPVRSLRQGFPENLQLPGETGRHRRGDRLSSAFEGCSQETLRGHRIRGTRDELRKKITDSLFQARFSNRSELEVGVNRIQANHQQNRSPSSVAEQKRCR